MISISESKARAKKAGAQLAHPLPGEEVVISGLSGRFPDCDDVYEFRDKLFNKIDLVSDDARRWNLEHPDIPQRTGKINNITKFDASYFGFHIKQTHIMDPMGRLLLERAYEAIVDAGVNPDHLRGTRCGVFIGACFSETEKSWFYEKLNVNGYGISGCSRGMLANRISYWLGVDGPSYIVDSACSSSLYAMEIAYQSIRNGLCDSAVVGSANLCLHPYVSLQFNRLGVLSKDGSCKSFDESANGYCRSEAVPAVFLQKSKDARRIYATIVHSKANCDGYKEQGITYPSRQMQFQLMQDFYEECEVDPRTINFIEAHGTGTKVGDPEECTTLDKIFCTGRKGALPIGSVKSNIGHTEPASGLCSITKAIIAMESGFIPPNIHFKVPRQGIAAFAEGRLKVVTDKEPLSGGLIGVNSFGFGGANCHILLKWNEKEKVNGGAPKDDIPRLVAISGRTEEAVKIILDKLESDPVDAEYVALFHGLHSTNIRGHIYRGYTILTNSGKKLRDIQYYTSEKKDVWFLFSGLNSQWPGMGKSLMKFTVFSLAVEKCQNALAHLGVDVKKLLTNDDSKSLNNIVHSIVAATAVQVGLVDVLLSVGISPDHVLAHSLGDFGCAYADGSLSLEQTILAAYYTGLALAESNCIRGAMLAVDTEYLKIKKILTPDIDVAFNNGSNSFTLSGPTESISKISAELKKQGVPVADVPCFNIPLHSRHVLKAKSKLLEYLKKVIPNPKPRSSKWICSFLENSVSDFSLSKLCSPEYLSASVLKPILFKNIWENIPKNAVIVEVTPSTLLQNVFEKSLSNSVLKFSLMQRTSKNNDEVLLSSIGKLYVAGLQPQLSNLYPPVQFPVSKGTSMISPYIRWQHEKNWHITSYKAQEKNKTGLRIVMVDAKDDDCEYLTGHVIDGRNLYPATGYLVLAWETIAMTLGCLYNRLPIVFEDVRFLRATTIPKEGSIMFTIMLQKASGKFEIIEGDAAVVTGRAYVPEDVNKELLNLPEQTPSEGEDLITLDSRDVYKELRLRGYQYSGLFKGIVSLDNLGRVGEVTWSNNFVAFMDNLLQTLILQEDNRSLYVPTSIEKLVIDPMKHADYIESLPDEENLKIKASIYNNLKVIVAGGIEIHNLRASQIPRKKPLGEPVLEKYVFVPYATHDHSKALDFLETLRLCLHVILENVHSVKVKVLELGDTTEHSALAANHVAEILGNLPLIQAEILVLAANFTSGIELAAGVVVEDKKISSEQNCLVALASNLLDNSSLLEQALKTLKPEGYLIVRENPDKQLPLNDFNVLVDRIVDNERILLLKSKSTSVNIVREATEVMKLSEKDQFKWIEPLKKHILNEAVKSIVLVAEKEKENGLIGLVNCLRRESGSEKIRGVFIFDENAPAFDLDLPFYKTQLDKGVIMNVLMNGEWGGYRHLALPVNNTMPFEHTYFNTEVRGDLSSLKMYEGPLNSNECEKEEIIVYYSSINFRDVMLASGKLSIDAAVRGRINQQLPIGLEFSGRMSKSGRRVFGMRKSGCLASKVDSASTLIWDVPDKWTLAEAASIPVVYGTVYSAMVIRGRLKRGESVLIHSGTGGVGLAALNVATYFGCNIFTTVGTQEKRDYLRKAYPQIPESHIGNSRDTSFEDMIKRETNGRGVDVILNSLAEEKLQASLRCLAPDGRFVEIGKFDLSNNNPVGMEVFSHGGSFHGVHLDSIFDEKYVAERNMVQDVVAEIIKTEMVKPIQIKVFDYAECEQAFRYLTTGKHIGKVMLKFRDEEPEKVCLPERRIFEGLPRMCCFQKKSYVIIGGLGGFGLELADWLVMRGARKLVLNSRKGLKTGYQSYRIRLWRIYGVEILISTHDITTEDGVFNLLKEAENLGPVDAIFNLAAVLADALFENQTEETFTTSFGPKAVATKYLDKISRKLCPELKHFVVFSSVSCGRGNTGQCNYGMANSVMERICESRVKDGYPGLAIQWGAIGEVGLVAAMQEDNQELVIGGTLQQTISSCLSCLDVFLKQKYPVVGSMVVAEKKSGGSGGGNVVDAVVNILGLQDLKTISMHSSLSELGMDSMMGVEIKQTLEREFDIYLTAQDIRGLTFAKLVQLSNTGTQNKDAVVEDKKDSTLSQEFEVKRMEYQRFLLHLTSDEETSLKPMIPMKHGEVDSALAEKLKAVHGKVPPVFLLPGLEGIASVMEPLAKNINYPSIGLQFPYNDACNASIRGITEKLLQVVKSQMVSTFPLVLVGYSTGALMAFEMAVLLEKEGYTGTLILIDGAPDFLTTAAKTVFNNQDQQSFDTNLLHGIYNIYVPGVNVEVKDTLNTYFTWEEKLNYLESIIPESAIYDREYQRRATSDLRHRLNAVINYDTSNYEKLSWETILIRPQEQFFPTSFPENYNLSKICSNPVTVHFMEGNHLSVLDNQKAAEVVNNAYRSAISDVTSKLREDIEFSIASQKTVKTR